jgi:hypothetical protein
VAAGELVAAEADTAGATAVTSATRPTIKPVSAENLNIRARDLTGLTSHFS